MAEERLTQAKPARDSTRALRATPKNIADAAAWLFLDEEQEECFRRALEGEPLARLLALTQWLADHERDATYQPEVMILGWAKKRGAGCFRPQDRRGLRTGQYAACSGKYPQAQLVEVREDNLTFHAGDTLCRGCARRHGEL